MLGIPDTGSKRAYKYSWHLTERDKRGFYALFNAGPSDAKNVKVELDNGTRVEPRTFHQTILRPSEISERFKIIRFGGGRVPTIRLIWQDPNGQGYSVRLDVLDLP